MNDKKYFFRIINLKGEVLIEEYESEFIPNVGDYILNYGGVVSGVDKIEHHFKVKLRVFYPSKNKFILFVDDVGDIDKLIESII
jgi:hypothetical protein